MQCYLTRKKGSRPRLRLLYVVEIVINLLSKGELWKGHVPFPSILKALVLRTASFHTASGSV